MFQAVPTAGDIIEEELKLQASLLVLTSPATRCFLTGFQRLLAE